MARSATVIKKDFGSGGRGISPGAGGQSELAKLLVELQAAVNETGPQARIGADAAANTASAERVIYRSRGKGTVTALFVTPDAAVAASGTDNATVTVRRRNADGSGAVTVAAFTTTTGNGLSQWVKKNLGALSNTGLTAGQLLTVQITKTGNGVQLPGLLLEADITAAA